MFCLFLHILGGFLFFIFLLKQRWKKKKKKKKGKKKKKKKKKKQNNNERKDSSVHTPLINRSPRFPSVSQRDLLSEICSFKRYHRVERLMEDLAINCTVCWQVFSASTHVFYKHLKSPSSQTANRARGVTDVGEISHAESSVDLN